MIRVTIGNNVKSENYNFDANTTLREALDAANITLASGMLMLDGASVAAGDLNKTFYELGYTGEAGKDRAFIMSVAKAVNA